MMKDASAQRPSQKVLIVDDHGLLNDTLVAAFEGDQTLLVSAVTSVKAAHDLIVENGRYDAILADHNGPGMDGLEGLSNLIEVNDGSVALFSGIANWALAERALKLGASGFIPKSLPLKTVGHAIRLIADGEVYLPSEMLLRTALEEDETDFGLKPREKRVLGLLCEGMPNKVIARELGVRETTVKMDVKAICCKLDARNRTEAVIKAMKMDLI